MPSRTKILFTCSGLAISALASTLATAQMVAPTTGFNPFAIPQALNPALIQGVQSTQMPFVYPGSNLAMPNLGGFAPQVPSVGGTVQGTSVQNPSTQSTGFILPTTGIAGPANGATYPYLPGHGLRTASTQYVDPAESRTNTVTYSPFVGRSHADLYYVAPQTRQLVDDRPHIATTSAQFQTKFANRRSGARQLDAQNRRSGYRIVGATQDLQAKDIIIQQPVRTVIYQPGQQVRTPVIQQRITQPRLIQPRIVVRQPQVIQRQVVQPQVVQRRVVVQQPQFIQPILVQPQAGLTLGAPLTSGGVGYRIVGN